MRRAILAASGAIALAGVASLGVQADTIADCERARDPQARLKACTSVIEAAGSSQAARAVAHRNRGNARAEAGAIDQAIADFDAAIRLAPSDGAAHAGRAYAQLRKGNTDAAIANLNAALNLAPGDATTATLLVSRGHARLVKGQNDGAIADFSESLRLRPGNASALNNRGLAWRHKGRLDNAIEDYTAAIAINPVYALAYNNRGYAYEQKGMKVEAIADFDRALTLDPSLTGAVAGLKRLGSGTDHTARTNKLIADGKKLVETNCSRCHAVGMTGVSPNSNAPAFRQISSKHPVLALRDPLTRSIAAPHDEMPKFVLADADIDKVVAYINSLGAPERK